MKTKNQFSDRQNLLWLIGTIRGVNGLILLLTLVRVALASISIGYALSLRQIVDQAVSGSRDGLLHAVAGFLGLVLLQFAIQCVSRFLSEYTRASAENQLKQKLLRELLERSYGNVVQVHSGQWLNRLTSDAKIVADSAAEILPGFADMVARLVGAVGVLLVMMPDLSGILLIGAVLLLPITYWMRKGIKRLQREIQEKDGQLRVSLTEWLSSLIMIRAYQQEDEILHQAVGQMNEHRHARLRKNHFSNLCNGGFVLAMNFAFVLCAAYCGWGILNGTLSYGTFMAAIQLVGQLQYPLSGLTGFIPKYYAMLVSVDRLREPEHFTKDASPCSLLPGERFCGFGLEDVSFTYPSDHSDEVQAVEHLSLEITRGEFVALAGSSGCGKSTVLKLLLGLYQPDCGSCYIRTVQEQVPLTPEWGRLFAYVPQGNHLMQGSIRDVVSFAAPERKQEEKAIRRALDAACALEFVDQLPAGIDTPLGERGAGLSEGQMQRLAVARAVFSDRPVLLLDEATSALDEASERRLLQNLRSMEDRTIVIVSHRPAAMEIADRTIYWKAACPRP